MTALWSRLIGWSSHLSVALKLAGWFVYALCVATVLWCVCSFSFLVVNYVYNASWKLHVFAHSFQLKLRWIRVKINDTLYVTLINWEDLSILNKTVNYHTWVQCNFSATQLIHCAMAVCSCLCCLFSCFFTLRHSPRKNLKLRGTNVNKSRMCCCTRIALALQFVAL